MNWLKLIPLLVFVLLIGCGETVRLSENRYPPKPKYAPIEVFYGETPSRPFERLGIVKENSEWTSSGDALITALKHQARELGADALLLGNVGTHQVQGAIVVTPVAYGGGQYYSSSSSSGRTTTIVTPPAYGGGIVTPTTTTLGVAEGVAIRWIDAPTDVHPPMPEAQPSPWPTQPMAGVPIAPVPAMVAPASVISPGPTRWQLAVNAEPVGAAVLMYDERQQLVQIGTTPCAVAWPPRTMADAMVVRFQGRDVVLLPHRNESVFVNFSNAVPVVEGADVIRR